MKSSVADRDEWGKPAGATETRSLKVNGFRDKITPHIQEAKERATDLVLPGLDVGALYSSKLSARSALYTDLQLLLDGRPKPLTAEEYRKLVLDGNCLSRGSSAARQKIWSELRKRYPLDRQNPLFNAFWQEWQRSQSEQERALTTYIALALNDRLVADIGTEWLCPYLKRAPAEIRVPDLRAFLETLGRANHPEVLKWTESTKHKVAKHFLASVRDFGLAQGRAVKKSIRRHSTARLLGS